MPKELQSKNAIDANWLVPWLLVYVDDDGRIVTCGQSPSCVTFTTTQMQNRTHSICYTTITCLAQSVLLLLVLEPHTHSLLVYIYKNFISSCFSLPW